MPATDGIKQPELHRCAIERGPAHVHVKRGLRYSIVRRGLAAAKRKVKP